MRRLWLHNRSFVAVRMLAHRAGARHRHLRRARRHGRPRPAIKTPTRHAGVTILRVPLTVDEARPLPAPDARRTGSASRQPDGEDPLRLDAARLTGLAGRRPARRGRARCATGSARSATRSARASSSSTSRRAALRRRRHELPHRRGRGRRRPRARCRSRRSPSLHALLPEVQIVGLAAPGAIRALPHARRRAVLPRGASAATVAKTVK